MVEKATGNVIRRETAEKQVTTVRTESGTGEAPVSDSQKKKAVLTDAQAAGGEIGRGHRKTVLDGDTICDGTIASADGHRMDAGWRQIRHRPGPAHHAARRAGELPEPPLEWKTPYPQPLPARGSSIDLLPDAVSPLFITLGLPILTEVFERMYAEVMGLARGRHTHIRGHQCVCFYLLPQREVSSGKYMLVHAATAGKLYEYGKGAGKKCGPSLPQW